MLGVPADFAFLGFAGVLALLGLVATLLFVGLLRICAPYFGSEERSAWPWLGLGALGAMAVGLGGLIGARDLLVANLGFAPVLAVAMRAGLAPGGAARPVASARACSRSRNVAAAPIGQLG